MSNAPQGPGWWQGPDGSWYPPESSFNPQPGQPPTFSPSQQQFPPGSQPYQPSQGQPFQPPSGGPLYGQQGAPYLATNVPPSSGRNSQAPIIIILLIVLLLIIIGALAYFFIGKNSNNSAEDPRPAVVGFFSNIIDKNLAACNYTEPSERKNCKVELSLAFAATTISGHVEAGNYVTQGNEALVVVLGTLCTKSSADTSPSCDGNSDPNKGLPNGQSDFAQKWMEVSSGHSSNARNIVPCVKDNGVWYVYVNKLFGNNSVNSGNSGTTTTAVNSGNSGTTTTAGNSGNSGTTTTAGNSG